MPESVGLGPSGRRNAAVEHGRRDAAVECPGVGTVLAATAPRRDLKVEAEQMRHLLTHKPSNPNCTSCIRVKCGRYTTAAAHFPDQSNGGEIS